MDQSKGEPSLRVESPETITRRIEGHIVRGAMDEECRAQKALTLLKARDHRIALLEKKIAELKMETAGHSIVSLYEPVNSVSSSETSGGETHYLSLPPSESDSQRYETEDVINNDDIIKELIRPKGPTAFTENVTVPHLQLPTTSVSNSECDAMILKAVSSDFNGNSNLDSHEFHHDQSSVDFVVTGALAFPKFDDKILQDNIRPKAFGDIKELKRTEDKKDAMNRSRTKLVPARMSASLPWIKTRRQSARRNTKRRIEKTRDSNVLSGNLQEVRASLDALLRKTTNVTITDSSHPEKQKVEDKVVQEDAQEAASTPDSIPHFKRKIASTQTCTEFGDQLHNPTIIRSNKNPGILSQSHLLGRYDPSIIWSDEPAPQWLIEEALKRGQPINNNNLIGKTHDNKDNHEDNNVASKLNLENIISELEKKLCATRVELADALNNQLLMKNNYKKALKNIKIAADKERDDVQQKLVKICTSVFEKIGPNALNNSKVKQYHQRHQKPLQHFRKLTRQLHRKLKVATLTSTKLKQEIVTTKKDFNEKVQQFDLLRKSFENLKFELKNAEININDLRNENITLRKGIDEAREWIKTTASKERHEKINAAQFREIQRTRELSNLKKKSEEDLSTIAQLRSKLLRLESTNSNKGFLLSNYKIQVADLAKDKEKLSMKVKEVENENSVLRNNNAQLKASVTLINNEKGKINTESEKSETDMMERMQSKLATKYERSMFQKIDAMRTKYDKVVETMETKLNASENMASQYFEAIKRFLKKIHEYYQELDAERDWNCSEASEREAHETACSILNITPGELTGFLTGQSSKAINSWLSDVQKLTSRKTFAEDLGKLLFARAIGSTKN